jgi:uncharacterized membrane protein
MITGTNHQGLPSTFLNAQALADFWGYVIWFLKYNMPMIMIILAVYVMYMVAATIIDMVVKAKTGKNDDDDDDFEVRHY